jgi:hypothetical protein
VIADDETLRVPREQKGVDEIAQRIGVRTHAPADDEQQRTW